MKLHLLGTAGYHPTNRRHTACLMLPEVGVVLDAGSGMFRVRELICTPTLDIFLTHAHLDHVVGLTFLLDILHGKQLDCVAVHGQPEKLAAIDEHLLSEHIFPVKLPCEMRPLAGDVPLRGGGKLRYFPLAHPGGAVGFRLEWPGHSMAYVTDTTARGADSKYLEHIRDVDLLVHECYFGDADCELAERTGHSCATPVAELAIAAKAKRLLLVHTNPLNEIGDPIGLPTIRTIFPVADLAYDAMQMEF